MSTDNERCRGVHVADQPQGPQTEVEEIGAQAVLRCTAFPPTGLLDNFARLAGRSALHGRAVLSHWQATRHWNIYVPPSSFR